jgi:hypothetical protein
MSNNALVVLCCIAGGVIALGLFYILWLNRYINYLRKELGELLEENWELRRGNRFFKPKNRA